MLSMRFSWHPAKAESNLRKHGISFETAASAFADPFALSVHDRIEGGEQRWQTLGLVEGHLQIGRAHVRTPVTNAHLVCRLLLEKKKKQTYTQNTKIHTTAINV